jgi:murein DD-endopeptidase MepM/ murein hydrolase activator NlpD
MNRCILAAAASASAIISGCGSHAPAPIVYATPPTTTGRVYHSAADYDRVNGARPSRLAFAPSPAPVLSEPLIASADPGPLGPIHADIVSSELPPAPTYVAAAVEEPAPASGARVATVAPGDTVYAIARRTGASPQAIIAENGLKAPYTLEIGDTLRIPDPQRKIANRIGEPAAPAAFAPADRGDGVRVVRSGDTLFSISRATGASVQAIAQANRLSPPYALEVGDRLTIPEGSGRASAPIRREAKAPDGNVGEIARNVSYVAPAPASVALFDWPVRGAIIGEFGAGVLGRRNDGINIAAPVGTPVRAAADGEVVYRGSELDGYGNLLLIKHQDGFVTAYAHNDVMLVQKGQPVRKGQVIAKVGQTGSAAEPQLHFEVRQNLKAVDPKGFLEGQ